MKHRLPTHSERVRVRNQLNGKPYRDNPFNLPYNNAGELIIPSYMQARHRKHNQ
jgi:hypothetical protein